MNCISGLFQIMNKFGLETINCFSCALWLSSHVCMHACPAFCITHSFSGLISLTSRYPPIATCFWQPKNIYITFFWYLCAGTSFAWNRGPCNYIILSANFEKPILFTTFKQWNFSKIYFELNEVLSPILHIFPPTKKKHESITKLGVIEGLFH